MNKLRTYRTKPGIELAISIIRKNHLYVDGWWMQTRLDFPDAIDVIAIYYVDSKPVGCGLRLKYHASTNVMVYVKPKFRNKGIGTKLVSKLKRKPVRSALGIIGSDIFWYKCGVKCDPFM